MVTSLVRGRNVSQRCNGTHVDNWIRDMGYGKLGRNRKIRACEMRFLRSSVGFGSKDSTRIRSSGKRSIISQLMWYVDVIERNKLRWFGHVERMVNRLLWKYHGGETTKRRPRNRWIGRVKEGVAARRGGGEY